MGISENIKKLREIYGLTQENLAEIAGVTNKAVSTWETGSKEPRMGAIEKIAKRFGIKKSNLIEDKGMENLHLSYPLGENTLIKGRSLDVPLYGYIAAGMPLEMIIAEEYIEIPSNLVKRYPKAFLLRITGDSMNKVIPNGAYALINPCQEASNGEIVAVTVNDSEATLKRFYRLQNTIALEPDSFNPEYTARLYDVNNDEIVTLKIIGKMVWYMAPFDEKF